MNDRITRYIQKLKAEKKKQKQAAAFITAMSLVVSGTVSWQLHGIGTAMIDENLTEKTDENIHQLSDDTLLCENPQIWENDLPDITGSNIRESVALIAGSQIGYEENTENFILDEDGESHKCYTRYGDWYGNPYGEWNTMFTYFCMKYGGVDEDDIPFGSGCWAWSVDLEKENLLIPMDRGSPQRGDVLLLDSDMDGSADRSGIVSELANEDDEKLIKVIEGNVGGTVAEQEYSIDDEHIIGFLALADNAETAVQTEATEAEVPIVMKFSGISESGVEVMASADVGTFPEGTVMTVSDIDHDEAVKAAKDSLDADTEMLDAVAVDISFSDKDGNEIEPCADTTVQVQIILPDERKLKDGEFSLLHIADSGDVQKVENAGVSETGAEFVAEEFSLYVIVSNPEYSPDNTQPTIITQYPMSDGGNGGNSAENPLIIGLGEIIEIVYQGDDYADHNFTFENNDLSDSRKVLEPDWTYYPGKTDDSNKTCTRKFTASNEGTCNVKWKNDNNNSLYVKVVENAIFRVKDGKRTLFTDNTITANKGDKFTLSLNGYNSGAISPKSDNETEVEYDISSCLKRGVPSYINNNTYVEFTCMEEGVQKITVNGKEITVLIGNPPYIMDGTSRKPLDTYLSENFVTVQSC